MAAMDERSRLLAAYDEQLRGRPDAPSALAIDALGPLWLTTYAGGRVLITYRDLGGADAAGVHTLVADALAHCRADPAVVHVDWKSRGHDAAPVLHEALTEHGFEPDDPESIMIGPAAALAVDAPLPEGVTLRQVREEPDVRAFAELESAVFGGGVEPTVRALTGRLAVDPLMEIWVAEARRPDGSRLVVSGGRLEPVAGTDFAGLWGGATLAGWRRRGIYRALTAARARSALRGGFTLMNSDSTEDSRPILERSGFLQVSTTTPYRLDLPARAA
ncbi:GNAT family N-acetyltransferase [Agrococcus baldri]|uniref:N-acetyltransferase n=1 Tax=Agrococcus baldri TaxID=153730 RepID=A0AA87RDX4_9MICO|nr:GNAT family N-acetyltransferase [Agrococcus baldri]GEK78999.1 N-acetyltransferase [Agrococcus baldri]